MSQGKNRYTLKLVLGAGSWVECSGAFKRRGPGVTEAEPAKAASQVARSLAGMVFCEHQVCCHRSLPRAYAQHWGAAMQYGLTPWQAGKVKEPDIRDADLGPGRTKAQMEDR